MFYFENLLSSEVLLVGGTGQYQKKKIPRVKNQFQQYILQVLVPDSQMK